MCRAHRSSPSQRRSNTLRLSFVTVAAPSIERGVGILGTLLKEEMAR